MMTSADKAAIKETLVKSGIAHHEIMVFGLDRIYVSITCKSESAAKRFAAILKKSFKRCDVVITPTIWEAKVNKGLMQNPTMVDGFSVGTVYR